MKKLKKLILIIFFKKDIERSLSSKNRDNIFLDFYYFLDFLDRDECQKLMVSIFFRTPIRDYHLNNVSKKDEDFVNYIHDLICRDEKRMVFSKESLNGYYDLDIEINREIQKELKQYVRD